MKFLFDDPSFSFEALRAAGYAAYAGADLGEIIAIASRIPDGDEQAWRREWSGLAERIEGAGRDSLAAGRRVSAREALLRASNYYRVADFYYRQDPAADPALSERLAAASRSTFADAVPLLDTPGRPAPIPYEDEHLPGWFFTVDDSGARRPTLLFTGGYDSTVEELYFAGAAAALRRGFNVLVYDGPGQGSNVAAHRYFRHDWEATVTPAVDVLLTFPEVDPDRIALLGMSLGGYLAPRAAAFEHRLAACIAYDGVWSFSDSITHLLARSGDTPGGLEALMAADTTVRWVVRCGLWSFGLSSVEQLQQAARDYTMDGIAEQIRCPVLVLDAESDQFFKGQAETLYAAITSEKDYILFTDAKGAGEHCQEGATLLFSQRTFDWLQTALQP